MYILTKKILEKQNASLLSLHILLALTCKRIQALNNFCWVLCEGRLINDLRALIASQHTDCVNIC